MSNNQNIQKTGTKGLKSVRDLSNLSSYEYRKWLVNNSKNFTPNSTFESKNNLFKAQELQKILKEDYNQDVSLKQIASIPLEERNQLIKQSTKDYNNAVRQERNLNEYSPYNEDGSFNPEKGVGDLNTFGIIMGFEPQSVDALRKSIWKPEWQLNKEIEQEKRDKNLINVDNKWGKLALTPINNAARGVRTGFLLPTVGFLAQGTIESFSESISHQNNKAIFDKINEKDVGIKSERVKNKVSKVKDTKYSNQGDEEIFKSFINMINEYIPALASQYDKKGNALTKGIMKLRPQDMREWLAKADAYINTYGEVTAYNMLDVEARNDIYNKYSTFSKKAINLGSDILRSATTYTASKWNGLHALGIELEELDQKYTANGNFGHDGNIKRYHTFIDDFGNYRDKRYVKETINPNTGQLQQTYIDPINGKQLKVQETLATKGSLFNQGFKTDGTEYGGNWFQNLENNRYINRCEAFGSMDKIEQARAEELMGYSPNKPIYKVGEDRDYLWETLKMSSFIVADGVFTAASMGSSLLLNIAGKALTVKRAADSTNILFKSVNIPANVLKGTSKLLNYAPGTLGAIGIGHDYGTQASENVLIKGVQALDSSIYNQENELFHNNYNNNSEFKEAIDRQVNDKCNAYIAEYGESLQNMPPKQYYKFIKNLKEDLYKQIAQTYIEKRVEERKNSQEYTDKLNSTAEEANNAARITAFTDGAKYFIVNNWGFRKILYRNSAYRSETAASKFLEKSKASKKTVSKKVGKSTVNKEVTQFSNEFVKKTLTPKEKFKLLSKVTAQQMWGGAWTNYTDEMQRAGGEAVALDRLNAYFNGDYEASGNSLQNGILNSAYSYLNAANATAYEPDSFRAGLVGALGSTINVGFNLASVFNPTFKTQWKNAKSRQEKASLLIQNGILNSYFDQIQGMRQANDIIECVNKVIQDFDDFQDINKILELDLAHIDATNPLDESGINFINAVLSLYQLKNFTESQNNDPLLQLLEQHDYYNKAVQLLEQVSSDNFSEEFINQQLNKYYENNEHLVRNVENDKIGIESIKKNAELFKKGLSLIDTFNTSVEEFEKSNNTKISNQVKSRLLQRFALNQFLEKNLEELESLISTKLVDDAIVPIEVYGHEETIQSTINGMKHTLQEMAKHRDTLAKEIAEATANVDKFIEEHTEEGQTVPLLTSEEQEELNRLKNIVYSKNLEHETVNSAYYDLENRMIILDSEHKQTYPEYTPKVLSANEILNLPPLYRIMMLDKYRINNYSEEQKLEINKALEILKSRNIPLETLYKTAQMQEMLISNKRAYDLMLKNPEGAYVALRADDINTYHKIKELEFKNAVNIISELINYIEKRASISNIKELADLVTLKDSEMVESMRAAEEVDDEIDINNRDKLEDNVVCTLIRNNLIKLDTNTLKRLIKNYHTPEIEKYKDAIIEAFNFRQLYEDSMAAVTAASEDMAEEAQKVIQDSMLDILNRGITREGVLAELETIIDSNKSAEILDSDRALYKTIYTELKEIIETREATSDLTPAEIKEAQDVAYKKRGLKRKDIEKAKKQLTEERNRTEEFKRIRESRKRKWEKSDANWRKNSPEDYKSIESKYEDKLTKISQQRDALIRKYNGIVASISKATSKSKLHKLQLEERKFRKLIEELNTTERDLIAYLNTHGFSVAIDKFSKEIIVLSNESIEYSKKQKAIEEARAKLRDREDSYYILLDDANKKVTNAKQALVEHDFAFKDKSGFTSEELVQISKDRAKLIRELQSALIALNNIVKSAESEGFTVNFDNNEVFIGHTYEITEDVLNNINNPIEIKNTTESTSKPTQSAAPVSNTATQTISQTAPSESTTNTSETSVQPNITTPTEETETSAGTSIEATNTTINKTEKSNPKSISVNDEALNNTPIQDFIDEEIIDHDSNTPITPELEKQYRDDVRNQGELTIKYSNGEISAKEYLKSLGYSDEADEFLNTATAEKIKEEADYLVSNVYNKFIKNAEQISTESTIPEEVPEVLGEVINKDTPEVLEITESPSAIEQAADVAGVSEGTFIDVPELEDDGDIVTYEGNMFYRYDINNLKHNEVLTIRQGTPGDFLSKVNDFLSYNKINLQKIIDTEVYEIFKNSPKRKIHLMLTDMRKMDDVGFPLKSTPFLTVEYDESVQKIHNEELGGVITSGGKRYLIIGIMGARYGNRTIRQHIFDNIVKPLEIQRKQHFDSNPTDSYFVSDSFYTTFNRYVSGYKTKMSEEDTTLEFRSITELLADKDRNPLGLTLEDLKWGIQFVGPPSFQTINLGLDAKILKPKQDNSNLGASYVFIPTGDAYIPIYIKPIGYTDLKDGKLKTKIINLLRAMTSTNYVERIEAEKSLRSLLVLKKSSDWFLLGTEKIPTITVLKNGIKVGKTFTLNKDFNIEEFFKTIEYVNPRINITFYTLSDAESLRIWDEAGALQVDVSQLYLANSSFTVNPIGADGKPIEVDPTSIAPKNSEESINDGIPQKREGYKGITYELRGADWVNLSTGKKVTDANLAKLLRYNNMFRISDMKPVQRIGFDEIFILVDTDHGLEPPFVVIRRNNDTIIELDPATSAAYITRYKAEKEKQEQEAAAKKALKEGTPVVTKPTTSSELALTESIGSEPTSNDIKDIDTDEEETMPVAKKQAKDIVERIKADAESLELTEDESFYRDKNTGALFVRVTSVKDADSSSTDKFDKNSPYTLPSTTLGTFIDAFLRDSFIKVVGNKDSLSARYPNATTESLQKLYDQIEDFIEQRPDYTFVANGITISGMVEVADHNGKKYKLPVAGTIDLLAYDNSGKFYLYDFKTIRTDYPTGYPKDVERNSKWTKQLYLYKLLLEQKYGIVVEMCSILPIKVEYPNPTDNEVNYTKNNGILYNNNEIYTGTNPTLLEQRDFTYNVETFTHNIIIEKLEDYERDLLQEGNTSEVIHKPVIDTELPGSSSFSDLSGFAGNSKKASSTTSGTYTIQDILNMPDKCLEFNDILTTKYIDLLESLGEFTEIFEHIGMPTTNIIDIDKWLQELRDC